MISRPTSAGPSRRRSGERVIVDLADGTALFAHTGGVDLDASLPTVVLVHGAGTDHSFWRGQTRYLAHHGFAVLAIDLPGHGRSGGAQGDTIESRGDAVVALLDALDVPSAALVGHSMGSLVGLDVAGRHPDRAWGLAMLATNPQMAVHPVLIESARSGDTRSLALTRAWAHGSPVGGDAEPGEWLHGVNWRTTEAVGLDVYADDFVACDTWTAAPERAATVTCPALVVSGRADRMTTVRGGGAMAELLGCVHVVLDAGHQFPQEAPWETTKTLLPFLRAANPGL